MITEEEGPLKAKRRRKRSKSTAPVLPESTKRVDTEDSASSTNSPQPPRPLQQTFNATAAEDSATDDVMGPLIDSSDSECGEKDNQSESDEEFDEQEMA